MWMWWFACGPRLPPGPIVAAEVPVAVQVVAPAAGEVAIDVVARAGSAVDPPGREGTAWLVADAVFRPLAGPDRTLGWWVEADAVRATLVCAEPAALACADALAGALTAPDLSEAAAQRGRDSAAAALSPTTDADLGPLALDLLEFRAHPRGHAPAGRRSVWPTLRPDELAAFHHTRWTRDRLSLVVHGPEQVADALRAGLAAAPLRSDPLRPMSGDGPPLAPLGPGSWAVTRPWTPEEASVWFAFAPDADADALADALDDELMGTLLVDHVTPLDAAGRFRADTTPERVAGVLAAAEVLPPGVVVALVDAVSAEGLASSGGTRRVSLEDLLR